MDARGKNRCLAVSVGQWWLVNRTLAIARDWVVFVCLFVVVVVVVELQQQGVVARVLSWEVCACGLLPVVVLWMVVGWIHSILILIRSCGAKSPWFSC